MSKPKIALSPTPALLPMPLVLVTAAGKEGPANIITIAYTGVVCGKPPLVSISIRPARHSHSLISASGEFVVNIPTASMAEVVDYCGSVSGKNVDKFAASGLTQRAATVVGAPLIAECPVNLECRVTQTVALGMHDMFIAEVVAAHADEDVLTEKAHIDISRLDPLAYGLHQFWTLGEQVGASGFTIKKSE